MGLNKKIKHSRYSTEGSIENEYEPGGKVLKNKLGIRTRKEIEKLEGKAFQKTQIHFYNLFLEEPPPAITENLIKEIHQHWLGEIYEWAGNYRRVNLSKGDMLFPPASLQDGCPNIPRLMKDFENNILKKHMPCRKGDDLVQVAKGIAIVHGEFEMIHPFREGNGRVGRLIADLMALQAGYPPLIFDIEGKPLNRKLYFDAMKEVFVKKNYAPNYAPLTRIIENAMKAGIEKAKKEVNSTLN